MAEMAKRFHIALASLPLIALGGCMQTQEQIAWSNRMHTQIVAQETTAELKIGMVVAGEKLGLRERDAVKGFAMAYQQEGHGAVIISRPSNGPDDISAMRAAADARAMMLAEGVDQSMIAEGTYDGTGARSAPLIISYRTYDAVVPNCPDISHWDFTDTSSNAALPSLGCAVAVNLAAMIANPTDLVGDQPTDPADIARRGIMFSKYRQGVRTSSERNNDASGAISTVVE
jgi:pilus assembly protein CpaD